jgi:signal transduction histidine kinase
MAKQPQHPPPAPGEAAAPGALVAVSPAMRAALFDPESWRESLEAYADSTNLAVALVDGAGRLLGPYHNPRPTWSRLHRPQETVGAGCPFALAPRRPCTCVRDALARRTLVLARDRTGLVHFAVPLVLDDAPVGALLAGQVFDQYPEQLLLEHVATHVGLSPQAVWQVARLEPPVNRATLRVYGRLLAHLGQAFLQARYHTLLDAQRLEALEQRFQERTAALHHEIAARQRLERDAQRVQHFALLGRLAAGVSHEIRNPLGAIFLHVDLLTEELQQPSPTSSAVVPETLAEIRTQLGRLEDLVQDYLSLVRVGTIQPQPEDLSRAVQAWATEFHDLAAPKGVALQLDGLAALGCVAVHAPTLRRAVLNLVQNALEAMPQGGALTFTGRGTPTHVQLQIRDTGSGIAVAHHAKIFEPLYTTKPGGTGLGLYIVQEIVAAHGGQVTVESGEGQGTTFTLTLPRVVNEAGQAPER